MNQTIYLKDDQLQQCIVYAKWLVNNNQSIDSTDTTAYMNCNLSALERMFIIDMYNYFKGELN